MSKWMRLVVMAGLFIGASAVFYGQEEVFVCPMDPDIRSNVAGVCERCGMKLVSGIPDPAEYTLDLNITPQILKPTVPASFEFVVRDPWKDRPVKKFQIVHEELFHLFAVSQDLKFFLHDHPVFNEEDGSFVYKTKLPKPGMYRILGDFYPDGSTPQLITKTIMLPGTPPEPAHLTKDYSPKTDQNMTVELETDPPQPIAHTKTMMFFKIKDATGFEKYLGAWGHMLAASDDLIDMIHTHPFLADGGPNVQFNVIFPRAHAYRVWVQFQRLGVVNTVYFDVPVEDLH